MKRKIFTKSNSFSSQGLAIKIRSAVTNDRKNVLTPRIKWLSNNLVSLSLNQVYAEVEKIRLLSNQLCCPAKPSYSMEEAATATQNNSQYLEPYICRSCGFVHFGHKGSTILDELISQAQKMSSQLVENKEVTA